MTLAFLVGAVAGAALALLFAPAPGTETRRILSEKTRESQDKAREAFERGREAFQKAKDKEPV
jgi:gas vesicle protein